MAGPGQDSGCPGIAGLTTGLGWGRQSAVFGSANTVKGLAKEVRHAETAMRPFTVLLILYAVLCLVALGFLVRWERRKYLRHGKAGAWLSVRLATIPIAMATAALVYLPARSTSGMEALAVFYILLIIAAPIFWFGSHWLVGRFSNPRLLFSESATIAVSPIVLAIALVLLAHKLQPIAWSMLRSAGIA